MQTFELHSTLENAYDIEGKKEKKKNFDFEFVTHHNRFSLCSPFFDSTNMLSHSIFHDKRWQSVLLSAVGECLPLLGVVFC